MPAALESMARLSRLIQGQDVSFDTHQAGDGQPVRWDGLHLEKRLHRGGKIRFPFFGERQPSWNEGLSEEKYDRIVREVQKALRKDGQLLEKLAQTIVTQLDRFSNGEATIEDAQQAARKIAYAFDLGEEFVASATVYADSRIARVATLHPGQRAGSVVEIVQSASSIDIQKPSSNSWRRWKRDAL
jgi:hypothetical protein